MEKVFTSLNSSNSRKQGDVGAAIALAYFAKNGYTVSVPLSDSQPYDLIVDNGEYLSRVQVKTSTRKNASGSFNVQLATVSNTRGKNIVVRKFDAKKADTLFIVTDDMEMYLIPSWVVNGKGALTVNKKLAQWKVN